VQVFFFSLLRNSSDHMHTIFSNSILGASSESENGLTTLR
jgi:hypothetical protein